MSVGTIWIAAGCKDKVITLKLEGDEGRNKNIANATQNALQLLRKLFQNEENEQVITELFAKTLVLYKIKCLFCTPFEISIEKNYKNKIAMSEICQITGKKP